MQTSWLILAIALYVSLDVASPLMPGALTFGVEDSVEIRQAERFRGHDQTPLTPVTRVFDRRERTTRRIAASQTPAPDVARTAPPDSRARSSLPAPASPSADH